MAEWTEAELAREGERRLQMEAHGLCPDSGYTIQRCWETDLCDCAWSDPARCDECPLVVWDLPDHKRRLHQSNQQE